MFPRPFDTELADFIGSIKLLSCLRGHWTQAFSLCALGLLKQKDWLRQLLLRACTVLGRSSTWGATSSRMRFIVALAFLATCQTAFGCGMVRRAGQHLCVRQDRSALLQRMLCLARCITPGPCEGLALTVESTVCEQLAASVEHIDAFIGTIVTIENDLLAPLAPFGRKLRQVRPSFVSGRACIPWQQPFSLFLVHVRPPCLHAGTAPCSVCAADVTHSLMCGVLSVQTNSNPILEGLVVKVRNLALVRGPAAVGILL